MKNVIVLVVISLLWSCRETGKMAFAVNFPKKEQKEYKIKQTEENKIESTSLLEIVIK